MNKMQGLILNNLKGFMSGIAYTEPPRLKYSPLS